jgi:hypothetical protein
VCVCVCALACLRSRHAHCKLGMNTRAYTLTHACIQVLQMSLVCQVKKSVRWPSHIHTYIHINILQLLQMSLMRQVENSSVGQATHIHIHIHTHMYIQVLQMSLMRQVENSSVELEEAKARCSQMEEAVTVAQRDASKALGEKNKLHEELREASQALLKRGDDFSESVSVYSQWM